MSDKSPDRVMAMALDPHSPAEEPKQKSMKAMRSTKAKPKATAGLPMAAKVAPNVKPKAGPKKPEKAAKAMKTVMKGMRKPMQKKKEKLSDGDSQWDDFFVAKESKDVVVPNGGNSDSDSESSK